MQFFGLITLAFGAVFASLTVGVPVELEACSNSGYATWFYPHFDGQGKCFKPTPISRGTKGVYVTVVDRCAGCTVQNVNLSPAGHSIPGIGQSRQR
ncbi:hypothetical protein RUND412_002938 [Rhizina undulata]